MTTSTPPRASAYFKPKSSSLLDISGVKAQRGINMVDLMMWLVIAALLLAAALQGIGYYQKAAAVYGLKNDLSNASSVANAQASLADGNIDDAVLASTMTQTKLSNGDSLNWGTISVTAAGALGADPSGFERASVTTSVHGLVYVITATNPAFPDIEGYYLFEATAGHPSGISIGAPGSIPVTTGSTAGTSGTTTVGAATKLAFTTPALTAYKSDLMGGANFTVQFQDAAGNPVPAPAAGSFPVTPSTTDQWDCGNAVFTAGATSASFGCNAHTTPDYMQVQKAGTGTLTVAATGFTSAVQTETIVAGDVDTFQISPAAGGTSEPTDTVFGQIINPGTGVSSIALDRSGNTVTSYNGPVAIAAYRYMPGGTEVGPISSTGYFRITGTTTVNAINGVATFTGLSIATDSTYSPSSTSYFLASFAGTSVPSSQREPGAGSMLADQVDSHIFTMSQ